MLCVFAVGCEQSPAQRRTSIYELQANPTEKNIQKLRGYLEDSNRDVRATALNVLVGLEVPDAVDLSLEALRDEDGFVRSIATKLLGDTHDPSHADALAERLLQDPDARVRQRAAEALARVGGPRATEALAQALDDPMQEVRLAAVSALRKLGPGPAKQGLARLLREDEVWEVRVQAAHALGLTGDPEVVPLLEAALGDQNEFVRSAAANALRMHEFASE
jgi:HEAT repeat protein